MPFDAAPLALPAYEQAYVTELLLSLLSGAAQAQNAYIYTRTRPAWQLEMAYSVEATGVHDPLLPAYEQGYVLEQYNALLPAALREFNQYILTRTPWYWQEEMVAQLFTFNDAGSDADAVAWITAAGNVSPIRQKIIGQFIRSEKAAGIWPLTDDYWVLWGENATQALLSLKQRRVVVPVGTPLFARDQGYSGSSGNYLNTGWIASTMAAAMTLTSGRLGVFEMTSASAFNYAAGVSSNGGAASLRLNPNNSGPANGQMTGQVLGTALITSTNRVPSLTPRFVTINRINTTCNFYLNGVPFDTVEGVVPQAALPTLAMFIIGYNSGNTHTAPRGGVHGYVDVGAALTPSQAAAHYANVNTMRLMVGS